MVNVNGPVIAPSAELTATTTGEAVRFGGTTRGVLRGFAIDVTAIAGAAPSVVTKVETSNDGTNWISTAVVTFTAVTAAPAHETKVPTFTPALGDVGQYVRVVDTFGGTTTSYTRSVTAITSG